MIIFSMFFILKSIDYIYIYIYNETYTGFFYTFVLYMKFYL